MSDTTNTALRAALEAMLDYFAQDEHEILKHDHDGLDTLPVFDQARAALGLELTAPRSTDITLTVHDGRLYIPNAAVTDTHELGWLKGEDSLLLVRYDAGDCDTLRWPIGPGDDDNSESLRSALFDAREMGVIPDVQSVRLPDGTEFTF